MGPTLAWVGSVCCVLRTEQKISAEQACDSNSINNVLRYFNRRIKWPICDTGFCKSMLVIKLIRQTRRFQG